MPTANEIMEQFYSAERVFMSSPPDQADFSGMAKVFSPDIVFRQTPALVYGGVYEGHEGFRRWAKRMNEYFSKVDVHPSNVLEKGDDVVILMTVDFKVRKTGEEFSMPMAQHVKVDQEKGVIVEFWPYYWDVALVNKMLGKED
ncbi:hypothetical protein H2198_003276 [Neophaeococcomyces mojaviensis]|uniref:Uncharacterized protein n=1 Tax=Neophaeococcomyces mojaviensis TaxID=3383035 RepID=A0ACC3ACL1_9EURO|nr:hypothetical protein H2198_003276 [Knufia sp. JES_112]